MKFLVDCGANSFVNLKRLVPDLSQLNGIMITHFHGDHFGGLPYILLQRLIIDRDESRFFVWAPEGAKERVRDLCEALYPGLGEKLVNQKGLRIEEYESNGSYDQDEILFHPKPVIHSPDSLPHAFRILIDGRNLGFSGDTEWTDSLVEIARGTCVTFLDCNFYDSLKPGHISYTQIVENREKMICDKLVLNHLGPEMLENEHKVNEIIAQDGQVFEI